MTVWLMFAGVCAAVAIFGLALAFSLKHKHQE